ncbi:MAG TPA: hypothetical protein VKK79_14055, partial [Candidatus Lokiarchaeia archaeon]|nr:hypothetical protein [Candidatus Lokiarchaeia archaeon]
MPFELTELNLKIEKAKQHILSLEPDYDGEGTPAFDTLTVNRAIAFLKKLAFNLFRLTQTILISPKILPGPEGSIDICWRTSEFQLLINFPADATEPATYYGNDYGVN